MTTYKSRPHPSIYRKIYTEHFGPIPKDELGRSYHIHHKDGNPFNNDPSNLEAIACRDHMIQHLQEHNFHWTPEKKILQSERLKIDNPATREEVKAKISLSITKNNLRLSEEGKHPSQKRYSCPHCDRLIGGKGNLTQHIRRAHGPVTCSETSAT